jgi:Co/Zn/Cd efflux system component
LETGKGVFLLEVDEEGVPPRFRLQAEDGREAGAKLGEVAVTIETERQGGARQIFHLARHRDFLESAEAVPTPHAFKASVRLESLDWLEEHQFDFVGHKHDAARPSTAATRDHNMRAAFVHVAADAAVSVLAICGLLLGRFLGWVFMDPVMGIVGALVIASWAFGLIRDTGGVLLDMIPDTAMAGELRRAIESDGDLLSDLHLWRLGPGHLGAIVSVVTAKPRDVEFYRSRLKHFPMLSHLTIEVRRMAAFSEAGARRPPAAG